MEKENKIEMTAAEVAAIAEAAGEFAEQWKVAETQIADVVRAAGGRIDAVIELPTVINDRFRGDDHKYYPRRYTKALVTLFADSRLHAHFKFGVEAKGGRVFFPEPNEHDAKNLITQIRQLRVFILWAGGTTAFIEKVLAGGRPE